MMEISSSWPGAGQCVPGPRRWTGGHRSVLLCVLLSKTCWAEERCMERWLKKAEFWGLNTKCRNRARNCNKKLSYQSFIHLQVSYDILCDQWISIVLHKQRSAWDRKCLQFCWLSVSCGKLYLPLLAGLMGGHEVCLDFLTAFSSYTSDF